MMYKLDLGVESPYLGSAYVDEAKEASTSAVIREDPVKVDYNGDCRMWYECFLIELCVCGC